MASSNTNNSSQKNKKSNSIRSKSQSKTNNPTPSQSEEILIENNAHALSNKNSENNYGFLTLCFLSIFLAVILIVLSLSMTSMAKTNKSEMANMREDYNYYQNLIKYAEEHPTHIIDAKVVGKFKNIETNRWYLKYTIKPDDIENNSYLDPYQTSSYAIYTDEQIDKYEVGDKIKVAVNSLPITTETDSMVVEYKDFKLENDVKYSSIKKDYKNFKTMTIVANVFSSLSFASGIAFLVIFILKMKNDATKHNNKDVKN